MKNREVHAASEYQLEVSSCHKYETALDSISLPVNLLLMWSFLLLILFSFLLHSSFHSFIWPSGKDESKYGSDTKSIEDDKRRRQEKKKKMLMEKKRQAEQFDMTLKLKKSYEANWFKGEENTSEDKEERERETELRRKIRKE